MEKYLAEVEKKLKKAGLTAKPSKYPDLQKYIGTQLPITGSDVWTLRKIYKEGFSFSPLSVEEQFTIWDFIWQNASLFDTMSLALFFADGYVKKSDMPKFWKTISKWQKRIDNWAHSDELSVINAHILEQYPDVVFPQLEKWNRSKNAWDRRQSIVSLIAYHKMRKKVLPFSKMIALVNNLVSDENYFVQKGVGWTLRELYNAYPDDTWNYLLKNYNRITGTAFAAASEKLLPAQKEKLKKMRKESKVKK